MKTLSDLLLVYMFEDMYICRVIYLLGGFIYSGYICIFIFLIEDGVILLLDFYKA